MVASGTLRASTDGVLGRRLILFLALALTVSSVPAEAGGGGRGRRTRARQPSANQQQNQRRARQRPTRTQNRVQRRVVRRTALRRASRERNQKRFDIGRFKGLKDKALVQALAKANQPKLLGYKKARQIMFKEIDNHGGQVTSVYTGRKVEGIQGIPKADSGPKFNAEHTTPQSVLRKAKKGAFRSDLHILAPEDTKANSIRGNLPFGEVAKPDWQGSGSKRGLNGKGKKVFEPRDAAKGQLARRRFYAATQTGIPIPTAEAVVLRRWHKKFPPTKAERERTLRVAASPQGNVNPFVLHPGLVDRINSF